MLPLNPLLSTVILAEFFTWHAKGSLMMMHRPCSLLGGARRVQERRLSRACTLHRDCGSHEYCFSWRSCRDLIEGSSFQLGDAVKVHSTKAERRKPCPDGRIESANLGGTFTVNCSDGHSEFEVRPAAIQRIKYLEIGCDKFTFDGRCGDLQLCEGSRDSIDGICPGYDADKLPMCLDLSPHCQALKAALNTTPTICDRAFHSALNGSSICCSTCAHASPSSAATPERREFFQEHEMETTKKGVGIWTFLIVMFILACCVRIAQALVKRNYLLLPDMRMLVGAVLSSAGAEHPQFVANRELVEQTSPSAEGGYTELRVDK